MKTFVNTLCIGLSMIAFLCLPELAQANLICMEGTCINQPNPPPASPTSTPCAADDSTCIKVVPVKVASSTVSVDTAHCQTLTIQKAVIVAGSGGGNISQDCPANMVMQSEYDVQAYGLSSGGETVQATCCPLINQWKAPA